MKIVNTATSTSLISKTSVELYRDCMRLIKHVAPSNSPKNTALKAAVRSQFKANCSLKKEEEIDLAKSHAVRALSNYMLQNAAQKDPKMQANMATFFRKKAKEAREEAVENNNNNSSDEQIKSS